MYVIIFTGSEFLPSIVDIIVILTFAGMKGEEGRKKEWEGGKEERIGKDGGEEERRERGCEGGKEGRMEGERVGRREGEEKERMREGGRRVSE